MTAKLSTHILDTYHGVPASGVNWLLEYLTPQDQWKKISNGTTNLDGRTDEALISGDLLKTGLYKLSFNIGNYFSNKNVQLDQPPFLEQVVIEVNLIAGQSYHVPLLCSPWSYSTYRGS